MTQSSTFFIIRLQKVYTTFTAHPVLSCYASGEEIEILGIRSVMNTRNIKSIQLKITLWAGCCLLLASAVIITYAALSLRDTAIEAAEEQAVAMAEASGRWPRLYQPLRIKILPLI
jgi:hypothetical protein